MRELSFSIYQTPTDKATVHHTKSGIVYHTKEQRFNADSLMTEMLQYRPPEPITDPIQLCIFAYFPIPQSKSSKWWNDAARQGYIVHAKKPDYDNILKQCADCLQKLQFIKNDSQIYHAIINKFYSDKPRWEITIKVVPNITRKEWEKMKGANHA